nr:RNA-directed DNA polymerase, eukaryota, reverse transcriptase zinc-binding domain protein [Tanacetum cinerariifolium]
MHGNHGALTSRVLALRRSPWLDVIRDIHSFNSKGINLMQFLKKKIDNGENTSFRDDKWLDDDAFKSLFPRLYALETCKFISVVVQLGHPSLAHSFRRPLRGGMEEEQLTLLGSRITDISLPNMSDHWIWSLEAFGSLSVRSAYIYIDENILPKVDVPTRWVKIIRIKVIFTLGRFVWISFLLDSTSRYEGWTFLRYYALFVKWQWNLHPIFSSLVPWLDKFGAKLRVGGRWMLPLLFAMKIGLIGLATFDFLSN